MFDLANVRYIEGAPMEWRRWLTPGTRVVLRFGEKGLQTIASAGTALLPWDDVAALVVRGPDQAESRTDDFMRKPLYKSLLGITHGPKVRWSWLAVALNEGSEIIYEVADLLRPELEQLLEDHVG